MKVLILSDANSVHTIRWVKSLSQQGVRVGLWSLTAPKEGVYEDCPQVVIGNAGIPHKRVGLLGKLRYLSAFGNLKRFCKAFKPDVLHAHFATSYGLLGRLLNFHPFIISVWGADVYDFPNKGWVFRKLLKDNLKKADKVLSTSHVMASETKKYTQKEIEITPFGIDLNVFFNRRKGDDELTERPFTIGTIKTLEEKYGVNYLIEAFSLFRNRYPEENLLLYIVGQGSQESYLKALAKKKGIDDICIFEGAVSYTEVPLYHNKLDVAVFLSILDSESFGVAAVEASATETPVIVSNVGGLPEVITDEETGLVVPSKDIVKAASAMERLFLDKALREKMGRRGRAKVNDLYNWDDNVLHMVEIYSSLL